MPSACEPSSSDSSPAIVESRGVRCGITSIPASRWIATDAIIPLIRARARGLSFTSTTCARPDSADRARRLEQPAGAAAERRVELHRDDELARGEAAARAPSAPRPTRRRVGGARAARRRRGARGAVLVDRRADRGDLRRASCRSSRRSAARRASARVAAKSAKYSGVACGNETRAPAIAREADVRQRGERGAVAAPSPRARSAPPPARGRGSRRTPRRRARAAAPPRRAPRRRPA